MKRTADERLARRLGIRMTSRKPGLWGSAVLKSPLIAYRFAFEPLVVKRGSTRRCRPGVSFYATSLGAGDDAEAWTKALEEYARAIRPSARPKPLGR